VRARRPEREPAIAVAALCLLGLVLRLLLLGSHSIWFDEAVTILAATRPGGEFLLAEPPLFTWLLRGWLALPLPSSEFITRLLPALLGAASLPFAYRVAREWLPSRGALLALALLACSPWEIAFAQEARMYSLVTLLTLFSTYALLRARAAAPYQWMAAYALAVALGGLAHPGFFMILPAHLIMLLLHSQRKNTPSPPRRGGEGRVRGVPFLLVGAAIIGALPGLLWLSALRPALAHTLAHPAESPRMVLQFLLEILEAWGPGPLLAPAARPVGLLAFAAAFALGLFSLKRKPAFVLATLSLLPPALLPVLVATGFLQAPMLRYAAGAHFFFLLAIAAPAFQVRSLRWLFMGGLLALNAASLGAWYMGAPPMHGLIPSKKPLREVALFIISRSQKGDTVASVSPSSSAPLKLYLPRGTPQSYILRDPTIPTAMEKLTGSPVPLARSIRGAKRVWMVVSPVRFGDAPEIPGELMPEINRLLETPLRYSFPGVDLYLSAVR